MTIANLPLTPADLPAAAAADGAIDALHTLLKARPGSTDAIESRITWLLKVAKALDAVGMTDQATTARDTAMALVDAAIARTA